MTDEAWGEFMRLPDPPRSEAIEFLCALTDGPQAVAGATTNDFGRYQMVLSGYCIVEFSLTAGERPGIESPEGGPYVHVWPPVLWEDP